MNQPELFLGRQPIVDRDNQLVAYELLFRSGQGNYADIFDDVAATATVIRYAFVELGLPNVLGEHRGFINVSAELLMSELLELLPTKQFVIELLETIEITPEVIARCKELSEQGYTLAMDDCITIDDSHRALLPYIDIVKVDLLGTPENELSKLVASLRRFPVTLLAEKVDSDAQYRKCLDLGFQLFQGYFFAKPTIMSGKNTNSANEAGLLRLLGLIARDAEAEQIENVFKQAPNLTVNLLKLVNSVAAGSPRAISSVRDAIFVLGRGKLKRWVQLLVFSEQNQHGRSHGISPLVELAATRGRMMELLATKHHPNIGDLPEKAFMTGMLSLLDVLFGRPLPELIEALGLSEEVAEAVVSHQGILGTLLEQVVGTEQAHSRVDTELQLSAMRWVQGLHREVQYDN